MKLRYLARPQFPWNGLLQESNTLAFSSQTPKLANSLVGSLINKYPQLGGFELNAKSSKESGSLKIDIYAMHVTCCIILIYNTKKAIAKYPIYRLNLFRCL